MQLSRLQKSKARWDESQSQILKSIDQTTAFDMRMKDKMPKSFICAYRSVGEPFGEVA